jgi:unsaturated chondroitin disaccharide hydrolase
MPQEHLADLVGADLVRRVDRTLEKSSGRFPVYAEPDSGTWTWSDPTGWACGFWPGLLWLSAAATGNPKYAAAATEAAGQLRSQLDSPTLLRGFLFWYGTAMAQATGQATGELAELAVAAARSLAADFDQVAGLLPPGEQDAELYDWPRPGACVDGLPGTIRLLAFASERTGDPSFRARALAHARGMVRLCLRADGAFLQTATYDSEGQLTERLSVNGALPDSTWSRGHAWGMLGLAQAAHLDSRFIRAAQQAADWYLGHLPPDLVCYWDFDDPAIPSTVQDTSASAIAAAALAKLAPIGGEEYATAARQITAALLSEHMGTHGGLVDGCYSHQQGLAVHDELIWGDYFLLEATLALAGVVDSALL